MKAIKNKLQGKKTYAVAALTTILIIIGHFLEWDNATIEKIIGAGVMGVGVFIRSGIASTLGLAEQAGKVAEVLEGVDDEALIKARAIQSGIEVFNKAPSLEEIEKVLIMTRDVGMDEDQLKFVKDNAASWLMKIAADPEEKG